MTWLGRTERRRRRGRKRGTAASWCHPRSIGERGRGEQRLAPPIIPHTLIATYFFLARAVQILRRGDGSLGHRQTAQESLLIGHRIGLWAETLGRVGHIDRDIRR